MHVFLKGMSKLILNELAKNAIIHLPINQPPSPTAEQFPQLWG